jgi:Cyclophilin type peptidyl-prolyl cis-trans isomerase/CLD
VEQWRVGVQVPDEYSNLPQLLGRATLEMNYTIKESRDSARPVTRAMTIVLDGYNAPVSAGCFLDLVNKHWYDGMDIQRADGFVVQTGKPNGKQGEGYVDPDTGKMRLYDSASWPCNCARLSMCFNNVIWK